MSDYIHERLKNRIVELVNTLISNRSIKAHGLSSFANITYITLSRDNSYATLYVSCLDGKETERSVNALNQASGFIQGRLAKVLNTRNTPRLTFLEDRDLQTANRIDAILDSIKKSSVDNNAAENPETEK